MFDQDEWDFWSRDELWRANNPGLSAARGWIVGMGVSLFFWAVIALLGWLVIFS